MHVCICTYIHMYVRTYGQTDRQTDIRARSYITQGSIFAGLFVQQKDLGHGFVFVACS